VHEKANALRLRVIERAVHGPGAADHADRRAAFENQDVDGRARALVAKVSANAWKMTDNDVAAAKAAGLTEDQVFELAVCAALGQATRQLDAALAAVNQVFPAGAGAERVMR
jgi:hypothetical protein